MLKTTNLGPLGAALLLAPALALTACGAVNEQGGASGGSDPSAEQLDGTLNGAGSSAQRSILGTGLRSRRCRCTSALRRRERLVWPGNREYLNHHRNVQRT